MTTTTKWRRGSVMPKVNREAWNDIISEQLDYGEQVIGARWWLALRTGSARVMLKEFANLYPRDAEKFGSLLGMIERDAMILGKREAATKVVPGEREEYKQALKEVGELTTLLNESLAEVREMKQEDIAADEAEKNILGVLISRIHRRLDGD